MIRIEIDARGLLHLLPNPLIHTVVYGGEEYYVCLSRFLESLLIFGKYRGQIAIFADKSGDKVMRFVPDEMKSQVLYFPLSNADFSAKFEIINYDLRQYSPVLYLDNDIIIDRDIRPLLFKIALQSGVCVTTEAESYKELASHKISEVRDTRRIGNWFGLDVLRIDATCVEKFLPIANSGIMGYREHDTFRLLASCLDKLYHHQTHANLVKHFGEQPLLNYLLVKLGLGSFEALKGSCHFLGTSHEFPLDQRGFAHFVWARGENKPRQMELYLRHLKASA